MDSSPSPPLSSEDATDGDHPFDTIAGMFSSYELPDIARIMDPEFGFESKEMKVTWLQLSFPVMLTMMLSYLLWKAYQSIGFPRVISKSKTKSDGDGQHKFTVTTTEQFMFCNVCRGLCAGMVRPTVQCGVCKYTVHSRCMSKADNNCKYSHTTKPSDELHHQWCEGNLGSNAVCFLCSQFCGSPMALTGVRCLWCQVTAHTQCVEDLKEQLPCSLGDLSKLIIPPNQVRKVHISKDLLEVRRPSAGKRPTSRSGYMGDDSTPASSEVSGSEDSRVDSKDRLGAKDTRNTMLSVSSSLRVPLGAAKEANTTRRIRNELRARSSQLVGSFQSLARRAIPSSFRIDKDGENTTGQTYVFTPPVDCTPLICFVNGKSGGCDGAHIVQELNQLLNPLQVIDISETTPKAGLELFRSVPNCRILVCGGDGSVGWVLSTAEDMKISPLPPIAVLPLGTGNDLARVLNWGKTFQVGADDVRAFLEEVQLSHTQLLDRWVITMTNTKRSRRGSVVVKQNAMNNYFGVGVDAKVALEFHERRKRRPELFFHRLINKVWYGEFGAREIFSRSCANLYKDVDVFMDGQKVELPAIEGIIVLNINSYCGGVDLWNNNNEHSCQDQLLEVVGVESSLHMGTLVAGLGSAYRLGQCRDLVITTRRTFPVQVDGEPWMQPPTTVRISHKGQALMLSRTTHVIGRAANTMLDVLTWAESQSVIDKKQKDTLVRELSKRLTANK
eukprot:GFYU01002157.1.p1 GENE.GFYU01002157.1~~GFYU01002157.1.p1  ORF type:complete len:727 (+),score=164.58 GFYU01002157.1:313-2493(+)